MLKRNRQSGTTLLEVLIAMVILSVGLLGLALLQAKSLKLNTDAMFRTQATMLANEIIESMRVNKTGSSSGKYIVPSKPAVCSSCTDSDGSLTANRDIISWYEAQANLLPSPTSKIERTGGVYTITMQWNERGNIVNQIWEVTI